MRIKRLLSVTTSLFCDQKFNKGFSKMGLISDFKEWKFSPPSYAELPIDEYPQYAEPRAVNDAVFSKVPTEPLTGKLHLVCSSDEALALLDLDPRVAESEEFVEFISGRYLPEGGLTVCHRYGGYQFGFWADQLGDGRAHILGEYINSRGERWQPQLKGCGETPYSRFADGRAVLRSSVREMVASEACHHLGVPTTRAAGLVVSEEHKVWRDKSYSGHAKQERAAVVLRLAPAWYRLGSFEILLKRKEPHTMATLAEFVVKHHFPEIDPTDEDKYVKLFSQILVWNLQKFAEALQPLLTEDHKEKVNNVISTLKEYVQKKVQETYLSKLGLKEIQDGDEALVKDLLDLMQDTTADFTATFRQLAEVDSKDLLEKSALEIKWSLKKLGDAPRQKWEQWVTRYRDRLVKENVSEEERRTRMCKVNPVYVPRNWILQEAIADAENNDFEKVRFLMQVLKRPFEVNAEAERRGYSSPPPSWSYGLKLSCSS